MKIRRNHRALTLFALVLACSTGCGSGGVAPADSDAAAAPAGASRKKGPSPEDLHPVVVIRTSLGDITAKLDAVNAPISVDNFMRYVRSGHYAGTIFHQVDAGFIAIGGGYTPDMQEKSTQLPIRNEAHNGLKNRRGTLAMSRHPEVIDSSTSQFFINLADNPSLDYQPREKKALFLPASTGAAAAATSADTSEAQSYGYCVFGEIISGQDVLDRIAQVQVQNSGQFDRLPVKPVTIVSIERAK